jgi:TonB family protein
MRVRFHDCLAQVTRYKLSCMRRFISSIYALAQVVVLSYTVADSLARNGPNSNNPQNEVVLTKLSPLIYPPVARQTRIAGKVELMLDIRPNGTVASAMVVSGHPLLQQAALESAKQSQFECRNCNEGVRSYRLLYSFELGPTEYCKETSDISKGNQQEPPYPRVTQLENRVTVVDRPVGTCDMASTVRSKKVRSAKCLYLWRCGYPRLVIYE